jgi:hypothetical protein
VGAAWKTQERIRQILTTLYTDKRDGISGNEDAGQMSAWYVLSAMGFYSVTPGMDYYVIGSPLFNKVTINLENGKKFQIIAKNSSPENFYIQSATLNGKPYSKSYLRHSDIVDDSKLVFTMGSEPNKEWASAKEDRPYSIKYESAPMPKLETKGIIFLNSTSISLSCADRNAVIHYTLDGSEPDESSAVYSSTFTVSESSVLKAKCFVEGANPGYTITQNLKKTGLNPAVKIAEVKRGLKYIYKEGFASKVAGLEKYPVKNRGVIKSFNLDSINDARPFGYHYSGFINIPKDGLYSFLLEANDGAILYIDGETLVNNDGGHQSQALVGKVGLKRGLHPVRLDYFQMGRAKKLVVKWKPDNGEFMEITPNMLFIKE